MSTDTPQLLNWADPSHRAQISDTLLWERFALGTALRSASPALKQNIKRQAERINIRLDVIDAASTDLWMSSRNSILGREFMADNIDEAFNLSNTNPNRPMVNIFIRDATHLAEQAWAVRAKDKQVGPFGGLLYLAWVLKGVDDPEQVVSVLPLKKAVDAARDVPIGQAMGDWDNPAVEKFILALADAGRACGIRDERC